MLSHQPPKEGQRNQLPVTISSVVTEMPRNILGLQGFGIFAVFVTFVLLIVFTNHFPTALIGSILMFGFIRTYIDAKPRHFLRHTADYFFRVPGLLRHHSHERRDPFTAQRSG